MKQLPLGYMQVATLLVSASYGIGFLFGSGELAVTQGMAGSMYAWVTGLGMLLLAILSGRIWSAGLPIWDMLGQFYGPIIKRSVALLSIVWMTGVLAAQILGGTAILILMGVPQYVAMTFILLMIFVLSKVNLKFIFNVFSFCLFGSSAVLIYILFHLDGLAIYFNAIPRFARDIQAIGGKEIFVAIIGVAFLVVTGADYQQFVIAAQSRVDAMVGCALSAALLLLLGALPASAVIAAHEAGIFSGITDVRQVIPFLISTITAQLGQGWKIVFLVGLLSAALGSGAAIVRAMASAVASSMATETGTSRLSYSIAVVLLGGIVAARAQGIVDTIVDLNIVYIASVAPIFLFLLLGIKLSQSGAQKAIIAGFAVSFSLYVIKWLDIFNGTIEFYSLCIGISVSTFVLMLNRYREVRILARRSID